MDIESIAELEARIAELRSRIPPHSIRPSMLEELEELEDKLEELKRARGCDDA